MDHRIKNDESILTNTNWLTFNTSTIPKKLKQVLQLKEWDSTYQSHYGASNAGILGNTRTYFVGQKSVANMEKRTHPILKVNAELKIDIQIIMRTTVYSVKYVAFIKRKKNNSTKL